MKIHLSVTGGVTAETLGETIVTLKKSNEKFRITRPISKVHNLVVGEIYAYFEGDT
jgi:hypothetical protein